MVTVERLPKHLLTPQKYNEDVSLVELRIWKHCVQFA